MRVCVCVCVKQNIYNILYLTNYSSPVFWSSQTFSFIKLATKTPGHLDPSASVYW